MKIILTLWKDRSQVSRGTWTILSLVNQMRFVFNSFHVWLCWLSLTPHNVWDRVPTFPWRISLWAGSCPLINFISASSPPASSSTPAMLSTPCLFSSYMHAEPTVYNISFFMVSFVTWLSSKSPCEVFLAIQQIWGHLSLFCRVLRAYFHSGKLYLLCLLAESLENSITYSRAKTVF